MKKISLLGSTGSVGTSTLEVVSQHPEEFQIVGLAAGSNLELVAKQVKQFRPQIVSVGKAEYIKQLREYIGDAHVPEIVSGKEGLIQVASHDSADFVLTAVVGSVGVEPTLAAIEAKKTIGLANKETLVSAGHIVMEAALKNGVTIIPVDSEHSAIFQCLQGEHRDDVSRILLTASGGSFRHLTRDQLKHVGIQDALNHPNWNMGAKITIDSATMMNKGLEVIEAHWLFGLPFEQIECVLHYESIIHSMVEYKDRAVMAQLGTPDMKVPIQYALSYPRRLPLQTQPLDLVTCGTLHFAKMDFERYPMIKLAYECGKQGGTLPTVMNAANEIAVDRFLRGEISFLQIEELVQSICEKHVKINRPDLETIFAADEWARHEATHYQFTR
ncbi:1-deoxy-D-xylulose-5-phosphate reductoisomerase [Brevibacillus sp. SYSU BS000544]|uniref:1-deoxy-D-xylulose-5-phosphate reductoisomerase n=1 Tax=Brevibacillus sp. SYSU BS000544 TaxID=3416443 RepID=UPI003CE44DC3